MGDFTTPTTTHTPDDPEVSQVERDLFLEGLGAVKNTGAETVGGVKDFTSLPTASTVQSTATGSQLARASDVNTIAGSLVAGLAEDDEVVKISGEQTISDKKIFSTFPEVSTQTSPSNIQLTRVVDVNSIVNDAVSGLTSDSEVHTIVDETIGEYAGILTQADLGGGGADATLDSFDHFYYHHANGIVTINASFSIRQVGVTFMQMSVRELPFIFKYANNAMAIFISGTPNVNARIADGNIIFYFDSITVSTAYDVILTASFPVD